MEAPRQPLGEFFGLGRQIGPHDDGGVAILLVEDLADDLPLGPDLGAKRGFRAPQDADDHPLPRADGQQVAYLQRFLAALLAHLAGQSLADERLDLPIGRCVHRRRGGWRGGADTGRREPLPGNQNQSMDLGGDVRLLDPAYLQEAMLRPFARRVGHGLVGEDVDLAAAQWPAISIAHHARLERQIGGRAQRQAAVHFIAGAIGQADDVRRLAAPFAQLRDPRGEGVHEDQQGDDHGERQGGQGGRLPANAEVAEVVAEWNFAGDEERGHNDGGNRHRGDEGQPGGQVVFHASGRLV
jgi:hypothetical protein